MPKGQGRCFCGGEEEKGAGCSFHSQDNYPHCDLNDPPFSPSDFSAHYSAPRPLAARLPPPCPVSGNMKTPIMKPFWLMEKGLLELHLPQRRLNYVSNCDNFPSIHGSFWKGRKERRKQRDTEREITQTMSSVKIVTQKWLQEKCKSINKYVNAGRPYTRARPHVTNKRSARARARIDDRYRGIMPRWKYMCSCLKIKALSTSYWQSWAPKKAPQWLEIIWSPVTGKRIITSLREAGGLTRPSDALLNAGAW